jgi:predicted Zn-ribbon and HTH transcriptional regulator
MEDIIKKFKEYAESLPREELIKVLTDAGYEVFDWKSVFNGGFTEDKDTILILPKIDKPIKITYPKKIIYCNDCKIEEIIPEEKPNKCPFCESENVEVNRW